MASTVTSSTSAKYNGSKSTSTASKLNTESTATAKKWLVWYCDY